MFYLLPQCEEHGVEADIDGAVGEISKAKKSLLLTYMRILVDEYLRHIEV